MRRCLPQLFRCAWLLLGLLGVGQLAAAEPTGENLALQIDGSRGSVELPTNLFEGLTEATFEGWFRWDRFGYFTQPVAFGEGWRSAGINLASGRAEVQFYLYTEQGTPRVVRSSGAVRLGEWVHLATVFGRAGMRLYVNGVLADTKAYAGMPPGGRNWLGRAVWAENEPFFGAMDELRLWRGERSAEQLNATLGRRLTGREDGLVALWNFDQRTADEAGTNALHGRVGGEVGWTETARPETTALSQSAVIAGRVVNSAGAAVVNAEVRLLRDGTLADRIPTDLEGEFSFAVPAGGKFSLTAKAGELAARTDDFEVEPRGRREVPLVVRPALSLSGVVQARDGTPQPHAVVQALRRRDDGAFVLEAMVRSRDAAKFSFTGLTPGRYRLRCSSMLTNYYLPQVAGTVCTDPAQAAEIEVEPDRPTVQVRFQLPVLKRGHWRRYTFHDGLADNRVNALAAGADDFLWVATEAGLSRFDGSNFTTFSLPGLNITALAVARDGTLWLGSSLGLVHFDGARFAVMPGTPPASLKYVRAVVAGADGAVWVASDSGLHRWQQDRWTHFTAADGLGSRYVNDLVAGLQGEMWVATRGGVTRWEGESGRQLDLPAQLFPQVGVAKLQADASGAWWCGARGMLVLLGGKPDPGVAVPQDFEESISLMRRTRAGVSWYSVINEGIYRCEGDRIVSFGEGDAFPLQYVSCLAETRDGRLWLGTPGDGLVRFDEAEMATYTARDGLPARTINSLARDARGALWVGSTGGLLRLNGEHLELLTKADGLPDNEVLSLKPAPDGTLWVGTAAGLAQVRRDGLRADPVEPSPKARIEGLEFDPDGELLFAAGGLGLFRWREGRAENLNVETGVVGRYGGLIFRERSGTLWRGVYRLERRADGSLGKVSEAVLKEAQLNQLADGPDGTLWAATSRGLRILRQGRFEEPSVPSPLGANGVSSVAEAPAGSVWLGSTIGLGRFDGTAWSALDLRDGLPGERIRALLCEPDGSLWLGADGGLARLRPNAVPPRAVVLRVESAGLPFSLAGGPRLVAGQAAEFTFTAVDFKTHPSKRQFRHRLVSPGEPSAPAWSSPTTAATLNWTPPSAGQFLLEVQAIDRDLNYSEPVQLRFTAAWPWHRNPWVLWPGTLGVLLLLALAAGYGWRYTVHRREALALRFEVAAQERAEQEHRAFARQLIETQEAERKRIAAELHDGLGQNLLVVKGRTTLALGLPLSPEARDHVQEISAVTAQALAEAREISHNLRPHQLDSLGLAKAVRAMARKVCEAAGLKLEIEVDDLVGVLAATQEIQLYRVAQEALNNVAKHSGAQTVWLSLWRDPDRVALEIGDDGHGFVRRESPRTDGGGFGLVTMQERMNLIGGTLVLDSTPGTGTRLVAEIPLAKL